MIEQICLTENHAFHANQVQYADKRRSANCITDPMPPFGSAFCPKTMQCCALGVSLPWSKALWRLALRELRQAQVERVK
jgi:hypothetical protein